MPFHPHDKFRLLKAPRIGPTLVAHLEAAGYCSLAQLAQDGASRAIARVEQLGLSANSCNRVRALADALVEAQDLLLSDRKQSST